ncbi:ABC transporter substrate-binding protein [Kribbella turkmenica]|uniref:Thiamine pyrimidine synthase n=1 Tax=Kribbella turkmenica TaxID=2530375 RepID=A0A4R4XF91_9ACTN|nr:ABC transporter substrate-binding protein [Kribbella turkmenica]TDD29209.1 ABC transporter substrate-binding protein [Kribbella turkmenica]
MDVVQRRSFIKGAVLGVAAAGGAASLLTGCTPDAAPPAQNTSGAPKHGRLDWQLAWIKNVQFSGSYIAHANGYYKAGGFDTVNFLSGGPTVVPVPVVASGKAFVTTAAAEQVAGAILQGADVVCIASLYEKAAFGLMSLADKPITSPQGMKAKRIGVQVTNTGMFESFLSANGVNRSDVTVVPVQFDPAPLTTRDVDGMLCMVTVQPVSLNQQGYQVATWLFNDFNYPKMDGLYVVRRETLTRKRDKVKAMLKAEIRGWRDAVLKPETGARLAVDVYGSDLGLDVRAETDTAKAQNPLIYTARRKTEGILSSSAELREQTVQTLGLGGIAITDKNLFDNSVLDEVFAESPELRSGL